MRDLTNYQFHKVATLDEIAEKPYIEISVEGRNILLCRSEEKIYAVENRCSHQDRKLAGGLIRRGQISCPVHGARFDLATGNACSAPANRPIATFAVREVDGVLEVAIPIDNPEATKRDEWSI